MTTTTRTDQSDEQAPSFAIVLRGYDRDQVDEYEGSGGTTGTTLRDTGLPVVIVTNRGAKTGAIRKTPLMRVEHEGRYAAVGSKGGDSQRCNGSTGCTS